MQWAIRGEEHSTNSDHEVIIWEVSEKSKPPALEHFTGWDLSGSDLRGCSEEEAETRKTERDMAAGEWREASAKFKPATTDAHRRELRGGSRMDPENHRNHSRQVCKTEACLRLEQTVVDPGDRRPS